MKKNEPEKWEDYLEKLRARFRVKASKLRRTKAKTLSKCSHEIEVT